MCIIDINLRYINTGQQLSMQLQYHQRQQAQLFSLPVGMSRRFAKLWPLKQIVRE